MTDGRHESFDFGALGKIILVGSAGSGKSHMARKLAAILRYPLVHLDNEFWKPGWVKTPKEEWIAKQKRLLAGEKWIIDGNYESSLELRFEAAELVIFLDLPRVRCIWNALRRHGKKRSDLPDYLEEKLDGEFVDFCKWIWSFPKKGKRTILDLHQKYPYKPFLVIKNRRQMRRVLRELETG